MPDEDVHITIEHQSTMMNVAMVGGNMPPMMAMMGMMGMSMAQAQQQNFGISEATGDGDIKCACCGNSCKSSAKFCENCGYKLK